MVLLSGMIMMDSVNGMAQQSCLGRLLMVWVDGKIKAQGGGWIRNWMRWDGESLSGSPRWFLVSDETWETTVQRLDI